MQLHLPLWPRNRLPHSRDCLRLLEVELTVEICLESRDFQVLLDLLPELLRLFPEVALVEVEAGEVGLEGRNQALLLDELAIDLSHPRVDEYLLCAVEVAQPFARVLLQQSPQQALDFCGEGGVAGEGELLVEDALVDFLVVEAVVGRDAEDQLVEQRAQAVIVESEGVASSG